MSLTDKTFEDFLREKLERPVPMKSAPGITVLPLEAMAMSVMNNAMKGDIPSIAFVNNLIKKRDDDTPEQRAEQKKKFKEKCDLIRSELQKDGLWDGRDNVPAVVKPGEVWQLGEHRLMCGDSTSEADVQALMMGEKADLWLTDPPYNVAVENSQGMTIANDNMSSENFGKFLSAAFSAAFSVLAEGCPFYVWFASKEHINFEGALNSVGLRVRQELIWNKNHFILGRAHYQWKHEPCLYGWKGGSCKYFVDARNRASVIPDAGEIDIEKMKAGEMRELLRKIYGAGLPTTVIDCDKPMKDADHPTMKPVKLFGFQMQNSTIGGGIVLDTFGGSGTTIVAAEQLGRRARLMELDPHYCDVIIARWEKLTGKKATKIQ